MGARLLCVLFFVTLWLLLPKAHAQDGDTVASSTLSPPPATTTAPPPGTTLDPDTPGAPGGSGNESAGNQTSAPELVRPKSQDAAATWILVVSITLGFIVGGAACYVTLMWQQQALRIYNERFEALLKESASNRKKLESQLEENEARGRRRRGDSSDSGDDGKVEEGSETNESDEEAGWVEEEQIINGKRVRRMRRMTDEEREQAKLDSYGDPDELRAMARKVAAENREREKKLEAQRRLLLRLRSTDNVDEVDDDVHAEAGAADGAEGGAGSRHRRTPAGATYGGDGDYDDATAAGRPALARRAAREPIESLRKGPMMVRRSAMASNPLFVPSREALLPSSPQQSGGGSNAPGGGDMTSQHDPLSGALQQSLSVHENLRKLRHSSQLRHIEGLI